MHDLGWGESRSPFQDSAVSSAPVARTFEVRHLQLARALFAAIAAVMITFSPDHSAPVGLAVFSGFAIASGLVFFAAAWLVYPAGRRAPAVLLGVIDVVAGMVAGVAGIRTDGLFFGLVISWAVLAAIVEIVSGVRGLRADRAHAREGFFIGILTAVLAVGIAVVPTGYALQYYIEDAGQSFTLTGITIAVGIFGAYAAIVAVYLGIAGFSPRKAARAEPQRVSEGTS